jgi:hypothetical protein
LIDTPARPQVDYWFARLAIFLLRFVALVWNTTGQPDDRRIERAAARLLGSSALQDERRWAKVAVWGNGLTRSEDFVMALVTRTVSINAAFLQEIKDDHHELRQLLHHAAAMLNRPSWMPAEIDQLYDLFEKLRDQLAMHFALEEAYGYFEDAVTVAPHLCRRAERLRAQHDELYSELCGLADRVEAIIYDKTSEPAIGELAADFGRFCQRLQRHELEEREMILAALDDDLGAGD